MSTRALYTFKGETKSDTWNVYKHHDGYPTGAANVLKTAVEWFAWKAPRYEADEFAASFIAAGKCSWLWGSKLDVKGAKEHGPGGKCNDWNGGGVRMMPQGDPMKVACVACKHCSDIEYRYEIYSDNAGKLARLHVKAYKVSAWEAPGIEDLIIACPLNEFGEQAEAYEKKSETKRPD